MAPGQQAAAPRARVVFVRMHSVCFLPASETTLFGHPERERDDGRRRRRGTKTIAIRLYAFLRDALPPLVA